MVEPWNYIIHNETKVEDARHQTPWIQVLYNFQKKSHVVFNKVGHSPRIT
jgi:hypothetical protein